LRERFIQFVTIHEFTHAWRHSSRVSIGTAYNVIIKITAVYHTVNGDPALFHTSKTAKMIKVRAPCQNVT